MRQQTALKDYAIYISYIYRLWFVPIHSTTYHSKIILLNLESPKYIYFVNLYFIYLHLFPH